MLQELLLHILTQTGLEMSETGSQPYDTRLLKEMPPSAGSTANRHVTLFTTKAEYIALSAPVQEAVWLQQLTNDLLNKSIHETTIFEHQFTICLTKNQHPMAEPSTLISSTILPIIWPTYCPTVNIIADMFTKRAIDQTI